MKRVLFIFLLFVLTTCTTTMKQVPPGPLSYRQGYRDGCDCGYVAAGHPYYKYRKDVYRYQDESLYKQGWDDGYDMCKSRYESIGRSLR